jgi:hypothetical protein
MASEESTGAISGAAEGAAAGAVAGSVVPGIGTVVGAVVGGVIGLIGGLFGGGHARKSRLALQAANAIDLQMTESQQAIQRRDMIRQARISQATALAQAATTEGGIQSSGSKGVQSSLESQTGFNLGFLDTTAAQTVLRAQKLSEAGKEAAQAQQIQGLTTAVLGAASAFGSSYSGGGAPKTTTTSAPGTLTLPSNWNGPH